MEGWGSRRARRLRPAAVLAAALVLAVLASCSGEDPPPNRPRATGSSATPSSGSADVVEGIRVGAGTVVVAAAGDIARSPEHGQGTAKLIRQARPDAVLALGDTAYQDGTPEEFRENYDPTWGKFRSITRPIPGNHEYATEGAAGYFDYFRDQIHDQEYYAWDLGSWRMYALNCEVDCGNGSEQLAWLEEDLASHDKPALAYVHNPYYTCSTRHPPTRRLDDIWGALLTADVQLVLSGDNHAYERFAPQDAEGQVTQDGIRQFVVGTGGVNLYPLQDRCRNREAQSDDVHGVLVLSLSTDSYSWRFVSVEEQVLDSGTEPVRR